jgi:hypothetical protein
VTRPAPSAALLARLASRFGESPGHAAWRARQAGEPAQAQESRPAEATPPPRQARPSSELPACGSFHYY